MTRKRTPLQPEGEWRGATFGQVADLRVWARQRVSERDADVLAQWLLGLGPDTEPRVSRRRLRFYRRLLRGYGRPRTVPLDADAAADLGSPSAPGVAAAEPGEAPDTSEGGAEASVEDSPDVRAEGPTEGSTEGSTERSSGMRRSRRTRGARGGGVGRPRA